MMKAQGLLINMATANESIGCIRKRINAEQKPVLPLLPSDDQSLLMSKLTDDLLCEIFLRLPHGLSVTQCSIVCKRWFSLITNPQFVLSFNQYHYNLYQYYYYFGSSKMSYDVNYSFYSSKLDKPIIYEQNYSRYMCTEKFDAIPSYNLNFLPFPCVAVWAFFNDLMLVSPKGSFKKYYVCNPYTKQWLKLPETQLPSKTTTSIKYYQYFKDYKLTKQTWLMLPSSPFTPPLRVTPYKYQYFGCRFVCETDKEEYDDITQFRYKVVLIYQSVDIYNFTACVFCSETRKWWQTHCALPALNLRDEGSFVRGVDVVSSDGFLYWLDGVRSFKGISAWDPWSCIGSCSDQNNMNGHLIHLPVDFCRSQSPSEGKVCIGVVLGQLRLLQLLKTKNACFSLRVWELNYGDDFGPSCMRTSWLLVHEGELKGVNEIFGCAFHPNEEDVISMSKDGIVKCQYHFGEGKLKETGNFLGKFAKDDGIIEDRPVKYFNIFTLIYPF